MASAMVIESADPIRARLKEHDEYPDHHPKEMKAPGKSVRFHYKASNLPELESVLAYIKRTYVIHAINKHCENSHLIDMRDYLTKFPLGVTEPDKGDTRYYKNAHKMVESITRNKEDPEDPDVVPEPVYTEFALHHRALQRKVYLYLRANYHRFMDNNCKIILDNTIAEYERANNLKGEDRLLVGKRYSWKQMQKDLAKLSSVRATKSHVICHFPHAGNICTFTCDFENPHAGFRFHM